jgi:Holliday junction resolvasome RuvABC endonuclease subunit
MSNILFLDLGSITGWSMWLEEEEFQGLLDSSNNCSGEIFGSNYYSGSKDLSLLKLKEDGNGYKYLQLKEFITKTVEDFEINKIYYEEVVHHGGFNSAASMSGMKAIVQMCACEAEIPCVGANVKTIKKFITGDGSADKMKVKEHVCNRLDIPESEIKDSNESDALALMLYVLDNED